MCLCASGYVEVPVNDSGSQYSSGTEHGKPPGRSGSKMSHPGGATESRGGGGGGQNSKTNLTYLSAAIGALAQDNPTASKLLLQLCTQARHLFNFLGPHNITHA